MKIFSFLKNHKLSFLIALVLLFAQANLELTLPGIMSDIVDVGISQGGIASAVPDKITTDDLADVELFLSETEADKVEALYSAPDADGVRVFTGTDEERSSIESFMAQAETLVYQLDQGISVDEWTDSEDPQVTEAIRSQMGDTLYLDDLVQMTELLILLVSVLYMLVGNIVK